MSYMFYQCSSLNEINLSNINTNNVTNMSYMFQKCFSLKEINLYNFNINKITNIWRMFAECSEDIKMKIKTQIKNINDEAFYD